MAFKIDENVLASFSDEVEKLAAPSWVTEGVGRLGAAAKTLNPRKFVGGLKVNKELGEADLHTLVGRVFNPSKGLGEAWNAMRPAEEIARRDAVESMKATAKGVPFQSEAEKLRQSGSHIFKENQPMQDVISQHGYGSAATELADRASRAGWTGQGARTKYLPIGGKSLTVGFGAMGVPSVISAPKPTPTGEEGAIERGLGMGLGTLGFTLGTGTGAVPMMALGFGADYVGKRLGRVLDRLRAGADLSTAVSAPSPTQAQKQLAKIQKYYG